MNTALPRQNTTLGRPRCKMVKTTFDTNQRLSTRCSKPTRTASCNCPTFSEAGCERRVHHAYRKWNTRTLCSRNPQWQGLGSQEGRCCSLVDPVSQDWSGCGRKT